MLEKIVHLDNVGVFRKGTPTAVALSKATLLYAENGRGKSTLAATLSSLGSGDAAPLAARKTFGSSSQKVFTRCKDGATGLQVSAQFTGHGWSYTDPNIAVFDQQFVERNVYAGSEVHSTHHEALLEFALGTAAVKKKQDVDKAGEEQLFATKRRSSAEEALKGYQGKTQLSVFLELTPDNKVDEHIEEYERRITAAKDASSIGVRSSLALLELPAFNFTHLRATLSNSLEDIHGEAERAVRAHLEHLRTPQAPEQNAETWLASGLKLMQDTDCPFCKQSTKDIALISAYRAFFNVEYTKLMNEVQALEQTAKQAISLGSLSSFEASHETNQERINVWSAQLSLNLDAPDIAFARAKVLEITETISVLVKTKVAAPLQPIDCSALDDLQKNISDIFKSVTSYNDQVLKANELITHYKSQLANEKIESLKVVLDSLKTQKIRFSPEVVTIVSERQQADKDRTTAETKKKAFRLELDALMESVLGKFQASINLWLEKFGAAFTVEKLKSTYIGGTGTPRTDYGVSIRGTSVPVGKKSASPCFQTALSDGDKRTLALAFFLARLFDEPDCANRIVVVDDIFTSLDKHRRAQTVDAIAQLARKVEQVIVLAHDAYFLRDVYRRLTGKGICTPTLLEVARTADGYSEIRTGFNLDEACATDYYLRYRALNGFLTDGVSEGLLKIAEGLRPLLEGHLHKRFPGHISEGLTVGQVLVSIKDAPTTSPLYVLKPYLDALHELNDFASAFHHDTSGMTPRTEVTDAELKTYGTRTLKLIHTGTL